MKTLGERNNNPGNLRDPKTGKFRVFKTPEEGMRALLEDLEYKKSGKSAHVKPGQTILDFAKKWAPSSDNNIPEDWARNVADALGVKTAHAWDEVPTEDFARAVQVAEGTTGLKTSGLKKEKEQQSKPKRLTREQMMANIDAMEKQGASQEEVQWYLDSLKIPSDTERARQEDIQKKTALGGATEGEVQTPKQALTGGIKNVQIGVGKKAIDTVRDATAGIYNKGVELGMPKLQSNEASAWYNKNSPQGQNLSASLEPVGFAQKAGGIGWQGLGAVTAGMGTGALPVLAGGASRAIGSGLGFVGNVLEKLAPATLPYLLYQHFTSKDKE